MISRRNIRVKVMQSLYALETLNEPTDNGRSATPDTDYERIGIRLLADKFNSSANLFTLGLLYLTKIAQFAEVNARQRASKYLATVEDMEVNTKIAGNTIVWDILENISFKEKVKEDKIERFIDDELVKKLYQQLVSTTEYKQYTEEKDRNKTAEKSILQFIWNKLMFGNEDFTFHFNDEWAGWEDDMEMIGMLMENFFKSHKNINYLQFISAEKRDYANTLLKTVLEKESYLMDLVKPKFKNWDAERIATIDLLLLKMGVAELLYFPTIPTKVTINEYIEIAKNYSTPQSGQFVNGVLDNLLKELIAENKIRKVERSK